MVAKVLTSTVIGLEAFKIEVEVDILNSLPAISIVGLPDTAVSEAKERVKSAIKNSGYLFSNKKVVVNLAPADIRKEGTNYDLPIAMGILIADQLGEYETRDKLISVLRKIMDKNHEFHFIGKKSIDEQIRIKQEEVERKQKAGACHYHRQPHKSHDGDKRF